MSNWIKYRDKTEIKRLQSQDQAISEILQYKLSDTKPTKDVAIQKSWEFQQYWRQWPQLEVHDEILYKKYVAENQDFLTLVAPYEIRDEIFFQLHVNKTAVRFGRDRTIEAIRKRFYWPGIYESVRKWCEQCDL